MLDKKTLDIVEDAISGDEKAFVKLCEIKGRDILYIAAHLMGNVSDGEDAAQEVLIYMYKNLHKLKDSKAFQAWLFRVMKGICVDLKRKNKRKRLLFHEKPRDTETREARMDFLPYEFYEDNSKKDRVLGIINKLPMH